MAQKTVWIATRWSGRMEPRSDTNEIKFQMNSISSKRYGSGVWIGHMDQGYGSPVRPGYGSGPYISAAAIYIIKSISPRVSCWIPHVFSVFFRFCVALSTPKKWEKCRDSEDPLAGAPSSRGAIATGMLSWAETATGRTDWMKRTDRKVWSNKLGIQLKERERTWSNIII